MIVAAGMVGQTLCDNGLSTYSVFPSSHLSLSDVSVLFVVQRSGGLHKICPCGLWCNPLMYGRSLTF